MNEKKRFEKKALNREDHKGTENAAKSVKSAIGLLSFGSLLYANKDKVKPIFDSVIKSLIKRS